MNKNEYISTNSLTEDDIESQLKEHLIPTDTKYKFDDFEKFIVERRNKMIKEILNEFGKDYKDDEEFETSYEFDLK